MDLRDKFAVHIASALAGALSDPAQIARRSYDFAEALVAERARRMDVDEAQAIADAFPFGAFGAFGANENEFNPDELDPEWLERQYDAPWDVETLLAAEAVAVDAAIDEIAAIEAAPDTTRAQGPATEVVRPGLARTQPAEGEPIRVVSGTGA